MSTIRRVTLQFRDGASHMLDVCAGQSVLDAALKAQVPVLHQCQSGTCSSCTATLADGTATTRAGASTTLLRSEFDAGQRLLCVTEPQTDCTFTLNYDISAGQGKPAKARAFIDAIEHVAHNVVRLTLELAEADWLEFKPGQFLQLTVPGLGVVRSYSPASTVSDLPTIVLLVRLLPDGAMSNYLRQRAAPDDVLEIEGPFGNFFLRDKVRAPHIMVAGGTGLAPMLSMIDSMRRASGRRPPMLLSFGCATPDDLFCLDDIALRQQWLPTLKTRASVDRGAHGDLLTGNPVAALCESDVTDADTVAYLCGPPPMVEAAIARLQALGVRRENIHAEQFTPAS